MELRRRDEQLSTGQGKIYAALYHSLTRWRDVDVRKLGSEGDSLAELPSRADDALVDFVGRLGEATATLSFPPAQHPACTVPAARKGRVSLFVCSVSEGRAGASTPTCRSRKTSPSVVLYYVFGCHGYLPMYEDVAALKKTSPSGGSLHPVGPTRSSPTWPGSSRASTPTAGRPRAGADREPDASRSQRAGLRSSRRGRASSAPPAPSFS